MSPAATSKYGATATANAPSVVRSEVPPLLVRMLPFGIISNITPSWADGNGESSRVGAGAAATTATGAEGDGVATVGGAGASLTVGPGADGPGATATGTTLTSASCT